jgi:hypothetical protein
MSVRAEVQNEGGYLIQPKLVGEILTKLSPQSKHARGWAVKMSHSGLAGAWLWPEGGTHRMRCSRTSGIAVFRTRKQAREAITSLGSGRPVKVTVIVREHTQKKRS